MGIPPYQQPQRRSSFLQGIGLGAGLPVGCCLAAACAALLAVGFVVLVLVRSIGNPSKAAARSPAPIPAASPAVPPEPQLKVHVFPAPSAQQPNARPSARDPWVYVAWRSVPATIEPLKEADQGCKYTVVWLTIAQRGYEAFSVNSWDFQLMDDIGTVHSSEWFVKTPCPLADTTLRDGEYVAGALVFQVRADASKVKLKYEPVISVPRYNVTVANVSGGTQ